jgi:hypothetical protein
MFQVTTMTTKKRAEEAPTTASPVAATSSRAFEANALVRLVYREVLPGDVAKFAGKSNITQSGGGARDFRFRPYSKFQGIFERLLSGRKTESRSRDGAPTPTLIYTDTLSVIDANGGATTRPIEFEPPTTAREDEGRLPRLNAYGLVVPSGNFGRVMLVLYQTGNGALFLNFATEADLRNNVWDTTVTNHLLDCLAEKRPISHAAQGFFDLATGESFCKCSGNH